MKLTKHFWLAWLCVLGMGLVLAARAADSFSWDARQNRITASVESWPLAKLLEKVTDSTGWQIYVEPDTVFTVSAKFKNLSPGEGLRALLGDLNFALVPQTNGPRDHLDACARFDGDDELIRDRLGAVGRPRLELGFDELRRRLHRRVENIERGRAVGLRHEREVQIAEQRAQSFAG